MDNMEEVKLNLNIPNDCAICALDKLAKGEAYRVKELENEDKNIQQNIQCLNSILKNKNIFCKSNLCKPKSESYFMQLLENPKICEHHSSRLEKMHPSSDSQYLPNFYKIKLSNMIANNDMGSDVNTDQTDGPNLFDSFKTIIVPTIFKIIERLDVTLKKKGVKRNIEGLLKDGMENKKNLFTNLLHASITLFISSYFTLEED